MAVTTVAENSAFGVLIEHTLVDAGLDNGHITIYNTEGDAAVVIDYFEIPTFINSILEAKALLKSRRLIACYKQSD